MATTINEAKTIALLDGTEIEVRPLKISLLREFMKSFEKISDVAESNEETMNLLLACVVVAFKQFKPELAEDAKALEDLLDLPTVYKIVEEASGIPMGYGIGGAA
jgi:hypothetical protein